MASAPGADYISVWSLQPTLQQLSLLDNPLLHGTPVQDFLSDVTGAGWHIGVYTARPYHHDDMSMPNAFSHYSRWQEYYEVCRQVAEPSPAAALSVNIDDATEMTPDLVDLKMKPCLDYLTSDQISQLSSLVYEFRDIFSVAGELGLFPPELMPPMSIKLKPGARPKRQRAYGVSKFEEDYLREECDRLMKMGVVEDSTNSPWVSPIVVVKEPNNKLRLCVNYQGLNKESEVEEHPMPRVDDVVASMSGCRYFTHLDVRRGFWHMPIAEEDRDKTTFVTPWGKCYRFTRCPFGLVNAPAAYQRAMDTAFAGIEGCRMYMDDNYTYSQRWDTHIDTLRAVFQRCRLYNIKLNWDKCFFGAPKLKCLGYVIGSEGVQVDGTKVAAILALPAPHNAKGVKSFLGMAGYFRQFIDGFAHITEPLTQLTKEKVPFKWTQQCQAAFDTLKVALTSAPCLRLPEWDRPFTLHVDWSKVAIGSYLSQIDEEGVEHPIAFASRLLTPTEQRYGSCEGECLALVWATHKFRYYLYGRHFTVYTDHKSLEWLQETRFKNSKVERWALRLQEFSFDIVHKDGELNVVADCLSRACAAQVCPEVYDDMTPALRSTQPPQPQSLWPAYAQHQSELDAIPCTICDHPGGHDNMAICSKCNQCYHLRCMIPPMTTVPSGDWYCPACDPLFRNGLAELYNPTTPLKYSTGDPYTRPELLSCVMSGELPSCPQDADPTSWAPLINGLRHAMQSFRPHPSIDGWLLVRRKPGRVGAVWLCLPPLEYRWDIIRLYHDALGHCGVRQTLTVLHQYFHWKGIKLDVARHVKVCDACQRRKLALPELPDLQEPTLYAGPFRHVHVDLAGPFPTPVLTVQGQIIPAARSESPQKAMVVLMIDYFTKAAEFSIISHKAARNVATAVYNSWFCRYGVPEHLTSDNGPEFCGEFVHMLRRLGVQHIPISACHPASNGAVERLVQTFKGILAKMINDHPEHWVFMIPQLRMAYVSRLHSAIGVSPFEMLHGVAPRLAPAVQVPGAVQCTTTPQDPEQYLSYLQRAFQRLDKKAMANIQAQFRTNHKAWQKRRLDVGRRGDHKISVGDLVLVFDDSPGSALHSSVHGPYRVVGFVAEGAVAVLQTGATALKPGQKHFHRHISLLAKYYNVHD